MWPIQSVDGKDDDVNQMLEFGNMSLFENAHVPWIIGRTLYHHHRRPVRNLVEPVTRAHPAVIVAIGGGGGVIRHLVLVHRHLHETFAMPQLARNVGHAYANYN